MSKYLVDTNILLDYPQIINERNDLVITTDILRELDGLKIHINPETSTKARRAAVLIARNLDKIEWNSELEKVNKSVDDKILELGIKNRYIVVTNDIYLKVKCIISGVQTIKYGSKNPYCGVRYWEIDENSSELEKAINEHKCDFEKELKENEYVIAKNKDGDLLQCFVYKNEELKPISITYKKNYIRNSCIDKIFPKNPEQICLFNALENRDITVLYAGGIYGSGKSFILNNFAIQELQTQKVKKIIYVPNNAYTENTMEIGTLPGELISKVIGQIGPLVDLMGIDEVNRMISLEQLEVVPMASIRGRSFQDSIIIVNEAQNLTEDHIKLLLARCGEGTRIFFDGDMKQTDSQIFKNKNGLKLLLELSNSEFSKIFAAIKLVTTERSYTAKAADYLDNLMGNV